MTPEDIFQNLEERAASDTALVAVLRRSLSYEPGLYPPAFPYIEPLTYGQGEWQRRATYLVAACWAKNKRSKQDETKEPGIKLAAALVRLKDDPKKNQAGESLTRRFTALLDADPDELPWRLRQITSQLSAAGIAVDWPALLNDLWRWNLFSRSVQVNWARQFWAQPKRDKKEEEATSAVS